MNTDDRLGITETIPVVGGIPGKIKGQRIGVETFSLPCILNAYQFGLLTPNPILNGKISIFRGFTKGYDPRLGRRKTELYLSISPRGQFHGGSIFGIPEDRIGYRPGKL